MTVWQYQPSDRERWESFISFPVRSTLNHSRNFLEYHGDKFEDVSLLCEDAKGRLIAVLPAARALDDATMVVSHPGATMGGVAFADQRTYIQYVSAMMEFLSYFKDLGFKKLTYKTTPFHIGHQPEQIDQYILWRSGARTAWIDLWSVINLQLNHELRARRKRALRAAQKKGVSVEVANHADAYSDYHQLLTNALKDRYSAYPVHSLEEFIDLRDRLGEYQSLWVARASDEEMIGGVWFVRHRPEVWHTQYIASTSRGREENAIDLIHAKSIATAKETGARYFSFGGNSTRRGKELNASLFDFKGGFGGGTISHYVLELDLQSWRPEPAKLIQN